MSFNFKSLSSPWLDKEVAKLTQGWTPRVFEGTNVGPSDELSKFQDGTKTDRTTFLTQRTLDKQPTSSSKLRESLKTQRTKLPSLGKSVQTLGKLPVAEISSSKIVGSQCNHTGQLETLLRALGTSMPKSLLNSYHKDLLEGLVHYLPQKHYLDLNHQIVSSGTSAPLPTNSSFAVRDKLRELVLKVESEHFPRIVQEAITSDDNIDGLLRDYTQTIVTLTTHAKSAGLVFVAEALESLWKFLVVALDKLFGIRQQQTKQKFASQIEALQTRVEFLTRDLREAEERAGKMKLYFEDRVGWLRLM